MCLSNFICLWPPGDGPQGPQLRNTLLNACSLHCDLTGHISHTSSSNKNIKIRIRKKQTKKQKKRIRIIRIFFPGVPPRMQAGGVVRSVI